MCEFWQSIEPMLNSVGVLMRVRRFRILAFLFLLLPSLAVVCPSWAGSETSSLDAAVQRLVEGERLRVRTTGYSMLRGYFLRAEADSIFLDLRSAGTVASGKPRWGGESMGAVGIERNEVDAMWKVRRAGVGRGLLWAGGAALAGGVAMIAMGDDEGGLILTSMVTIAAVPVAFVWGALRNKETMVYWRDRYE